MKKQRRNSMKYNKREVEKLEKFIDNYIKNMEYKFKDISAI